ncbi:MAG: anaerobic ribonucleoside-triphosphate reductase [Desulfomicrobium escambiense]|nr:anaerobic ribonucleoside-triphosphate reductase [Desulfomicrobium escambiense]
MNTLCVDHDGENGIRMRKASHLVGILGLNELAQAMTGLELHEGPKAMEFALAVTKFMELKCEELSSRYGLKIVLEPDPGREHRLPHGKARPALFPRPGKPVHQG